MNLPTRPSLYDLVDPSRTAVLVLEMQEGIVGDLAGDSPIAAAVREQDIVARCARLVAGARAAGVPVVHCTKTDRPVGAGGSVNTPMWRRRLEQNLPHLEPGSLAAAIVTGLEPGPNDVICERTRGVTAFGSTELDPVLRNMGVTSIVVCGISMNVGAIAATVDGVSLGYDVVIARDAVGGSPVEYVDQVLRFTLAPLAKLAPVGDLLAAWGQE